jgi:type IV secretory pathway TrbD component
MKLDVKQAKRILKIFTGALAAFLILFGIHWLAILAGVALGIFYFAIPERYLQ